MIGETRVGKRGPKPNPERGTPSGYRLTARQRFELQIAGAFTGSTTLQSTIDAAVQEYLDRLRSDAEGFQAALDAAERHQQSRSQVPRLNR